MTRFLLVRHTAHDFLTKGIMAGRQAGVHLNSLGKKQAQQLGEQLSILRIDAIYCSPLERACETAEPLAQRLNLECRIAEEFNEVDMGDWTNQPFSQLSSSPGWQRWNSFRSSTRVPNGESMLEVQQRVVRKIVELHDQSAHANAPAEKDRLIAVFSHGDVIRAALCHFVGLHLDFIFRLEIDPGCTSVIELGDDFVRVPHVNVPVNGISALDREGTTAC
jgi:probable phosphoglycerate mutase